ncbi:hypothetical protein EC991_008650 [Linnemannia zychae]|nr:hypothetical protein EC991_008650 [Linnemannia zychae]
MLQSVTISAPIPVPGTQQEPTTPSLGSTTTSTTIIHISGAGGNNSSELHKNNSNGGARITTIGNSAGVGVVGGNNSTVLHRSSSGSNGSSSNHNRDSSKDKDNNSGLKRFPSIGNTKKLHLDNANLRSKIAELERYLQGLKEELILAHRQIHAKNLEAKISQERKAVEIHELGQHIQRCEFDLLAKTAECEALQNKLQYQTKESVSKLKHINMLETEIMDYRRMSIMSAHGPSAAGGTSATGAGTSIGPGGMVARGGSVLFRNSRNSSDLTESVRSSAVLQDSAAAAEEETSAAAVGALQAQVKQLKDEHWKKDEQIQELTEKIQFLTDSVAQLEKAATTTAASAASAPEDYTVDMTKTTSTTNKSTIVSGSTSNASFNTATTGGVSSSGGSSSSIVVNSVGYDLLVEHPKLLSRYQALSSQHALASEYLEQLESENQDLKVQLLDISSSTSLEVTAPTVESPEPISVSTEEIVEEVKEVEQEDASTPVATTSATPMAPAVASAAAATVIPSISRNSLHHPAASGLTPLDTVAANANEFTSISTSSSSVSSCSENSSTGTVEIFSPISPPTSSSSPSIVTVAPALTRKSSLRYSRDGQTSPTSAATSSPAAEATTTTDAP